VVGVVGLVEGGKMGVGEKVRITALLKEKGSKAFYRTQLFAF